MGLFDGSVRDQSELLARLNSLGPTDVERLSEALHWPARRTVRAIRSLARTGGQIVYDASTGEVRAELDDRRPKLPPKESVRPTVPAPSPTLAGDLPSPGLCPDCRTPLTAAGTPGTFYCSNCGNLETHPSPAPRAQRDAPRTGSLDDRKAQELFAAWATSQPIPCPRCRRPLSHRGVQSYACPACGQLIRFAETGVTEGPLEASPVAPRP